jgi:hypothetical protein
MKLLLAQHQRKISSRIGLLFLLTAALLVILPPNNLSAQTPQRKTVNGRVTNDKGEAIAGASVLVKGTTTGVNTNTSGNYTISVANNATLVISYVGFDKKKFVWVQL